MEFNVTGIEIQTYDLKNFVLHTEECIDLKAELYSFENEKTFVFNVKTPMFPDDLDCKAFTTIEWRYEPEADKYKFLQKALYKHGHSLAELQNKALEIKTDRHFLLQAVKSLREESGRPFMHCKKAFIEADHDYDKALEILKKTPVGGSLIKLPK